MGSSELVGKEEKSRRQWSASEVEKSLLKADAAGKVPFTWVAGERLGRSKDRAGWSRKQSVTNGNWLEGRWSSGHLPGERVHF